MLKNNIENLLNVEGTSINKLAKDLNIRYATIYNIVKKENLDTIPLENLVKIADYLEVEVEDMYIKTTDPYEFEEVKILNRALELIQKNSHNGDAGDKAYACINELTDDIEEYGTIDKEKLKNTKKSIIDASKYAGYTNAQYDLQADVRAILDEI